MFTLQSTGEIKEEDTTYRNLYKNRGIRNGDVTESGMRGSNNCICVGRGLEDKELLQSAILNPVLGMNSMIIFHNIVS